MFASHVLGFPRIGPNRELKFSIEKYWASNTEANERAVFETKNNICTKNWKLQKLFGLDFITVGDFALYDHVLSTLMMVGGLPSRFAAQNNWLHNYFNAARGTEHCRAMEMKKWFNTNYHYMVPEYSPGMSFGFKAEHLISEVIAATELGCPLKVSLLGPVSLLWLGKEYDGLINRLELLPNLLAVYKDIVLELKKRNIAWIQMEEPAACSNLSNTWREALQISYDALSKIFGKILLTTYYSFPKETATAIFQLPVAGVHFDVTSNFSLECLTNRQDRQVLSVGIVEGRAVWPNDVLRSVHKIRKIQKIVGSSNPIWISTSCSLQHVPYDASVEDRVEKVTKKSLSFSVQKVGEVVKIKNELLAHSRGSDKRILFRTFNPFVGFSVEELSSSVPATEENNCLRAEAQKEVLSLPVLPTTTVGSFPQTKDLRLLRSCFRNNTVSSKEYIIRMKKEIGHVVHKQLKYGLDVLVHGEVERNDMVEYFGESLNGFIITKRGWVQSYGSRCTKPPIIVDDVSFAFPITAYWFREAQNLTAKPVKGMVTGPITILNWSFIRKDLSYQEISLQIAYALRLELSLLEVYGMKIIQIDEPAIREGLPLKTEEQAEYLDWVTKTFKILASCLSNRTQIHTHMCYSEFGDIMDTITKLPADVVSIEAARSNMTLLQSFKTINYDKGLGLGVYDIHSPEIPSPESIEKRIKHIINCLPQSSVWVNPDCGLKTRTWPQVDEAIYNLVEATKTIRKHLMAIHSDFN